MRRLIPPAIRRRCRGSAMVEFALGFPLVFLIMAGTFQFGYSFYICNRLESSVRGAARFASMYPYTSSNGNATADYVNAVKNYAVSGDPTASTPSLVPGLTTSQVEVQVGTVNGMPDRVRVSVNNFQLNAVFRTFTISGWPYASFRYAGRIAAL